MSFISTMTLLAIICFASGLFLVIVEMFHPGFGAPGITGGILLVVAVILTAKNLLQALILIIIIFIILAFMLMLALQSATKGRLSRILVLHEQQKKETGYTGSDDLEYFLDKEGVTLTVLRPAGTADFNGVKLDVVSEGEFIHKNTNVKIIKVQGRRIVVREIKK